jgi:hypothetical protein
MADGAGLGMVGLPTFDDTESLMRRHREYRMSLKKFVPLVLAASAALLAAAPARAAVVFEFESAAIDAFRNWTPQGQQPSEEQANNGNNVDQGSQGNPGSIDVPPPSSLLEFSTTDEPSPPGSEQLAAAVPEPATWALMALGLAGIAATRRRTSKR